MSWTIDQAGKQDGRVAIVTGANIGLGLNTALQLAGKGCRVVLACRNLDKAAAAKAEILQQLPKAKVECLQLDLGSLKSVRAFAEKFSAKHKRLDLLINNAGIMMPPYSLSEDGFESQLAANYLGHFALTGLLLPLLEQTPGSRVVSLSSLAHNWSGMRFDDLQFSKGYNKRKAYGQSKFACLMFAYELNRRLQKTGSKTLSVAAHPGVSATNLAQHFPRILSAFMPVFGQSAADGALPTLYAALGEDIQGGDYCGPKNLQQMRGAPVKVGSNRASRDEAAAKKLWTVSEELTGVSFLS
ncbi:NAD(P)-dependent dehydrogenase, short-chain alcohol dehydrogenase family [Pseudomonas pohangensis]|uniref:NAD(P)-dependent dehydrogenase, short-chain alcohol dehydrogenase family n=1 Tax=Pseudomonas pohangensis TaxID=364197 RepID=A0A1H2F7X2_9PSED|nr:oxidoreductase [Pseudomonas pohangensis]SDU03385.1 NAD(P)-dependent dehydrogenase, short-chain alcohol dehydrogenase family [Pseudomonas pohangensis]